MNASVCLEFTFTTYIPFFLYHECIVIFCRIRLDICCAVFRFQYIFLLIPIIKYVKCELYFKALNGVVIL